MKHISFILTLLVILTMASCTPELNFEEPQPTEDKDEKKIKNKFRGTYLCLADSSILTIDKYSMVQAWHIVVEMTKIQVDTTEGIEIRGGLMYVEDMPEPLPIQINGDTVVVNWDYNKTIFKISDDHVLRYFKGLYFLNYKESENLWTVKTMKLDKDGILTLNKIYGGPEEIDKIKSITTIEEITDEEGKVIEYKIRPTKKELKEIMRSNIVSIGNEFQKIRR